MVKELNCGVCVEYKAHAKFKRRRLIILFLLPNQLFAVCTKCGIYGLYGSQRMNQRKKCLDHNLYAKMIVTMLVLAIEMWNYQTARRFMLWAQLFDNIPLQSKYCHCETNWLLNNKHKSWWTSYKMLSNASHLKQLAFLLWSHTNLSINWFSFGWKQQHKTCPRYVWRYG